MARSRRLGVAKFLPAFGGNWWLFRDRFPVALAAGNVNGSSAVPGPGLRAVTDVESKIFTTGSRLRGGGQDSPVWGESKVVWTQGDGSGFARSPGRPLAGLRLTISWILARMAMAFCRRLVVR
jgi:hypothetical protein